MEAQKEALAPRQMFLNDCDREAGNPRRFVQVKTKFWAKPIPDRRFDWEAIEEDYDLGSPMGFGATEQEAIADLLVEIEARS